MPRRVPRFRFIDRRVLLRNLIISLVITLAFIGTLSIYINIKSGSLRNLPHLPAWLGPQPGSNYVGDDPELSELMRQVMERQIFRNDTDLDHEHGVAYRANALKLPWFMKGGTVRIDYDRLSGSIWPMNSDDDRIVKQLMYVPPGYTYGGDTPLKTIVLHGSWDDFHEGRHLFTRDKCPVDSCQVYGAKWNSAADAVIFKDFLPDAAEKVQGQLWILYLLESPLYGLSPVQKNAVNWTATYRRDSVIVTPYEKFVLYHPKVKQLPLNGRNFAKNKTKMVAWFVSHCSTRNKRKEYAQELAEYVHVDVYGECGKLKCRRGEPEKCLRMLDRDYKFYLAFENANCKDYITEKFYNALRHNVVPIVMGASPEEYRQVAPYHSYIHVEDFATAKDLAEYLKLLDRNSDMYNEYFAWKGTGEFINTFFWCRLCAMLHAPPPAPDGCLMYENVTEWWTNNACRAPKRLKS
ncbi:glycoprotein 3-alpha-L-fucosyltransferase A-like [Ornithodoros turicata]|uniref:glycoprotein 3-alpha-L-fucosyltransferase A-like n=1 Tax=Ornithodoros turicata TaxID=34597 RepID=UPI0031387150